MMVNLLTESFETDGNGVRYTTSTAEFTDTALDFYTRTDGTDVDAAYNISGSDGSFFFAMMDTDGAPGTEAIITMTFTAIDITGYDSLSFSGLFAEDDSTDGLEDWDANGSLQIEYSIDGGAFQDLLSFESSGGTNTNPAQDTNFDGVGDGTSLTSTLSLFSAAIAGTGASLVLRITVRNLTAGDEDIAFDNIKIDGNHAPDAMAIEAAAISYEEHGGAQNITAALTLSDAEDANLESAIVSITAGLDIANDSLVFVDQNGITGVYTAATGILALTGTATVADYQAAIRSITYINAFGTESIAQRTISVTVNDGTDDSAVVTRNIDFVVDESVPGTAGNDNLIGGFGDDVLNGLGGDDRLVGGVGGDTLNGGDDNDLLIGQDGVDTLNGDAGNDRLVAGDGDDILNGGAGDDRLWGGAGADAMDGGDGVDRVAYDTATARVIVNLATVGSDGDATGDTYVNIEDLFGSNFNDQLTGDANANTILGLDGDDIINGGAGNDRLVGGIGDDSMFGGDDVDLLVGQGGDDMVRGGAGADRLFGGDGVDLLIGDDGDDFLAGGTGDDTLKGGNGSDKLVGGAGADVFSFDLDSVPSGQDTIFDFVSGTDKIELGGPSAHGDLTLTASPNGQHTTITYNGHSIYVKNTTPAQLDAAQFTFIEPDAGHPISDKTVVADIFVADDNFVFVEKIVVSDDISEAGNFVFDQASQSESLLAQITSDFYASHAYEIGLDAEDVGLMPLVDHIDFL